MTKKMILPIIFIVLMAVGYSAISTSFFLDGTLGIEQGLFDVRFTNVTAGGTDLTKDTVSEEGKKFTYVVTDQNKVTYEVTNLSKDYDVEVNVLCTITPETIEIKNNFNNKDVLIARTSRKGSVSIALPETLSEIITLVCTLDVVGLERTEPGNANIEAEQVDYLKVIEGSQTSKIYLGHTLDKTKVESITLKDSKDVPDGVESWDASNSNNGSILAYTLDEDSDGMLELYIGQNGGVNANPNSSKLFGYFTDVTNINGLENIDTSNVTNMSYMFCDCGGLTNLDVSGFDTSNVTKMYLMFSECSSLTNLDISHFNTSKVTDMEKMFYNCKALTSLDVSGFDTSNVTNMNCMFSSCSKLTILDVSGFDTSNVTDMYSMFSSCSGLTSLDVNGFNTSNVTDMSSMFDNCNKLTALDVSGFDTSNVKNMQSMFYNCSKLTALDVRRFNTSKVTDMSSMFSLCYVLSSLDVSGFDMSKVTNMTYMFEYCKSLTTTITIRGTLCTKYGGMFSNAATTAGAQITVNYTSDASTLVDKMIATKSTTSNVIKGTVVA